jgi:DNA-binding MarR family transcriptional regulator
MLAIRTHPVGAIVSPELGDQTLLRHNGAVQPVERLCKADLARRTLLAKDRRGVLVVLTAKDTRLLTRLDLLRQRVTN